MMRRFCRCRPLDEGAEDFEMPQLPLDSVPAMMLGKGGPEIPCTRCPLSSSYSVDANDVLGRGSFSTVCKARHLKTREAYAVKTFKLDDLGDHGLQSIESEIAMCKQVQSVYTNKLLEVIYEDQCVHLILDLCTGGSLIDKVEGFWKDPDRQELLRMPGVRKRGLPCRMSAMYVWQILSAVAHMHCCHIMHRDVKLDNCMLKTDDEQAPLQLIDFGLACSFTEGERQTGMAGTLLYMAPEVLEESYTEKRDIWSIGVCCFIMCMGYVPFVGEDAELWENIMAGNISTSKSHWEQVSTEMLAVTETLMTHDLEKRPHALEVMSTNEYLKSCKDPQDDVWGEVCTIS